MKSTKLFFIALTMGAMAASSALARPAVVRTNPVRTSPVIARSGAHHWAHNNGDWRHRHHRSHIYFGLGYPLWYGYPYYGYYPYRYGSYAGPSEAVYQPGDSSIVIEVQRRLARAGYYRGAIDGVAGAGTRSAIRSYERTHGLHVDGLIDQRLLATMGLA
jgi:hypothetical protein